jgi:hypothetical protein
MTTTRFASIIASLLAAGAAAACTQPADLVPETCEDIADADPKAKDGEYTLYVDGDKSMPWNAYCHDMKTNPKEYLTLVRSGGDYNVSDLVLKAPVAGEVTETRLRTHFEKVRINPKYLTIDINDRTFAEASRAPVTLGSSPNETQVAKMPFGVAGSCLASAAAPTTTPLIAKSNIDLTGTGFVLAGDHCSGGMNNVGVEVVVSNDKTAMEIIAQSESAAPATSCAWNAPAEPSCPTSNPFASSSSEIVLAYAVD